MQRGKSHLAKRLLSLVAVVAILSAQPAQAQPSGRTITYSFLATGESTGSMSVTVDTTGARSITYRFMDRGRGPDQVSTVSVDRQSLPVHLTVTGVDYFKKPVDERFDRIRGAMTWRAANDQGRSSKSGFYLPAEYAPEHLAMLARALLRAPTHELPLLPAGKARIERLGQEEIVVEGAPIKATLLAISGLGFRPRPLWLDDAGELVAEGDDWYVTIRTGLEPYAKRLMAAQDSILIALETRRAKLLAERPDRPLAITGVRLFDPQTRSVKAPTTVVVSGNRIVAVGGDVSVAIPTNARAIDGRGKTMLPGLWDMHVHLTSNEQGLMHLAAGVTTVRDLANTIDTLAERRQRFDDATLVGDRVLMAGFIDGPGPLAAPIKVLASTPNEMRAAIGNYAAHGYPQIKLYSSLDPKLLPVAIAEAHRLGMRVSGHVPAGMTMRQAVEAGYDEVQHLNFAMLNFMGPDINLKSNGIARFTAVAENGYKLDLASPAVQDFIALLQSRKTVLDPTVSIFENHYRGKPGAPVPNLAPAIDWLPPVVRRGAYGGGLAENDQERVRNEASFTHMLQLLKRLHDAGIPIVPGTDDLAGFTYARELELHVAAGIPPVDVLYSATLGSATVMGKQAELGSIEPGKLADLILIDGDPTKEISDVRNTVLVVKDGLIFHPDRLLDEVGFLRPDAKGARKK